MESTEAPFFVDLVNDALLEKFPDNNFNRIPIGCTPAGSELAARSAEAVRVGMEEADKRIKQAKKEKMQAIRIRNAP